MSDQLQIRQLPSGYWHIRGKGPCNWAQPPYWPCSGDVFIEHMFPQAGGEFLDQAQDAALAAAQEEQAPDEIASNYDDHGATAAQEHPEPRTLTWRVSRLYVDFLLDRPGRLTQVYDWGQWFTKMTDPIPVWELRRWDEDEEIWMLETDPEIVASFPEQYKLARESGHYDVSDSVTVTVPA